MRRRSAFHHPLWNVCREGSNAKTVSLLPGAVLYLKKNLDLSEPIVVLYVCVLWSDLEVLQEGRERR